jgi:hypothetical protein
MAIDNFDLQSWMREQKQGPFNKKALKENIMGYADLHSYNSIREDEYPIFLSNQDYTGTSFYGDTITCSPQLLFDLIGEPQEAGNTGEDKTNYQWVLETDEGDLFTIYDYNEDRPLSNDEQVEWHIGARSPKISRYAKDYIESSLNLKENKKPIKEEEEEDMMDMKDDWYEKPEVDNTPDEDAIDRKATMKAMAMKKSKKADKSIEDLNKDFNKMLNFSDEEDDMYDPFYEGMGMSPEALDRMEGVVNTKHLQAFKQIFKSLVGDWMNDGFDQEDIVNYISGIGGFSTSHPFYNPDDSDDLENTTSNDAAFDSMMEGEEEGDTKTVLGVEFNIVPTQNGMKFKFKDVEKYRESGVTANKLVDEITKMLSRKFGEDSVTFIPAGRDQSDPKVNGLEFKINTSNFFKGL